MTNYNDILFSICMMSYLKWKLKNKLLWFENHTFVCTAMHHQCSAQSFNLKNNWYFFKSPYIRTWFSWFVFMSTGSRQRGVDPPSPFLLLVSRTRRGSSARPLTWPVQPPPEPNSTYRLSQRKWNHPRRRSALPKLPGKYRHHHRRRPRPSRGSPGPNHHRKYTIQDFMWWIPEDLVMIET